MRRAFLSLSLLLPLAACCSGPSEDDLREIARLDAVRDSVRRELAQLRADTATAARESLYGLLRRNQEPILTNAEAMLRQRAEAIRAGAEFTVTARAVRANPARADSLARQAAALRDSIAADERALAGRGDRGLLGAFAKMTTSMRQLTVTMLETNRIWELHGLPLRASGMTPSTGRAKGGTWRSGTAIFA